MPDEYKVMVRVPWDHPRNYVLSYDPIKEIARLKKILDEIWALSKPPGYIEGTSKQYAGRVGKLLAILDRARGDA
jgi:hypothetical protein